MYFIVAEQYIALNQLWLMDCIYRRGIATGVRCTVRSLLQHVPRRPEGLAILFMLAIDLVWMRCVGLSFVNIGAPLLAASGLLTIAVVYSCTGRSKRLSGMGYYGAMFVAYGPLLIVMSYLAAYRGGALCDAELLTFDAFLGFDWRRWAAFLRTHPAFDALLALAYGSLVPQFCVTIVVLCHMNREDRSRELFWTVLVSSLITTVVFDLFPALGPFAYYNLDLDRAIHLKDLIELRSGMAHSYSVPQLQGLIAFPSYHTVLAVLIPYVHRGSRYTFMPCAVLNALMLISTPSHGGHYLADIVGGVLTALGSIALVRIAMARVHREPSLGSASTH